MFAAIVGQAWATAAHPFNLEVNGIDYILQAEMASIRVEMPGPGTNGSMTVTLRDKTSTIDVGEWDEVRFIEQAATRPILFGGFVQSVAYNIWSSGGRDILLTCVGYGILLDKKVALAVANLATSGGDDGTSLLPLVVSLINRHGGRVGAVMLSSSDHTSQTDGTYSIPGGLPGAYWAFLASDAPSLPTASLRSALEQMVRLALAPDFFGTDYGSPAAAAMWVDSAALLRFYPDTPTGVWDDGVNNDDDMRYDAAVPGVDLSLGAAPTLTIEELTYEREDTDRLTSAYLLGGNAAGTGYFRTTPLERAGDLETLVEDSTSTSASGLFARAAAVVQTTSSTTVRGRATVYGTGPLDIWPGRHVGLFSAQLGISVPPNYRITSVVVTFRTSTRREYDIEFGGSLPTPRASRRSGRFQNRLFTA